VRLAIFSSGVLALAACTYEPPRYSAQDYENPERYTDQSATHPDRELFQAYLDHAVRDGLPGAALLIRTAEGTWAGAAGYADIASGVRWTPSMIARVGSVTKLFAAATIVELAGEDRLELAGLAREHLPSSVVSNIENADRATIDQLLHHTSGIFNYLESTELFFEAGGSYDYEYQSRRRLLEYAYGEDAEFDAGRGWGYSNTNFLLLDLIAEHASGDSSATALHERTIEPLGLRSTRYTPGKPPPAGMVRGYADLFADGDLIDVTDTQLEWFHYDGGVISNVYDLADFLDALLSGPLLSEGARTAMLETVPTNGESERGVDHYGAGLIEERHPEHGPIRGHSGTALGFSAHVYRIERYGITFAAIVNASQHGLEERSYRWFSPLEHDDIVRLAAERR
jgi:D-alanyl-D-alanine carboxypeptidase